MGGGAVERVRRRAERRRYVRTSASALACIAASRCAYMPRPRCSIAAVAEARVWSRGWSVVGRVGVRAPFGKEQGWCHLGCLHSRRPETAQRLASTVENRLKCLTIPATEARVAGGHGHSTTCSACEVPPILQNGNPGSDHCAIARFEEVG